jgi:hypothetical protein
MEPQHGGGLGLLLFWANNDQQCDARRLDGGQSSHSQGDLSGRSLVPPTATASVLLRRDSSKATTTCCLAIRKDNVVKGMGKRNVQQASWCSLTAPYSKMTSEQHGQLNRFRYVDDYRPKPQKLLMV